MGQGLSDLPPVEGGPAPWYLSPPGRKAHICLLPVSPAPLHVFPPARFIYRSAAKFIDSVKIPYIAPSLGGVESLIEMPAVQSYWGFGPEKRAEIGIKETLIRFSVGVEHVEDVWADLAQALDQVKV